jgi:putative transposase
MITGMRDAGQAARVAALTGCTQLPGKPRRDGTICPSRFVEAGPDFDAHRAAVESVSVLFTLHDGDAASWAETGKPGVEVPSGWRVAGARFEVAWPADPERQGLVRSHFGARRTAFNWGLAQVKADLDARKANPDHESVGWDMGELRKQWNKVKDTVAPWWRVNSKEAYASGLADLARALENWKAGKDGTRKGKRPGFPRFQSARRDPGRVRFTTGAMRLEPDRRTITLTVIGALRSKESTRRVQRHLAAGNARILNMTLSQRWGRLFVSVCYAVRSPRATPAPAMPDARAGVDLGLRVLATVSALDPQTGKETIRQYQNPAPFRAALRQRRLAGRQMARRVRGSVGWHQAKAKLDRLDRRCVHLRQEASHQLTAELTRTYGQVVVEDLDLAAMKKSMGRRAFRRSVSDAALGRIRPQLDYKAKRYGGVLTVADRWFPSSQLHHGCTRPDGGPCQLEGKHRLDKYLRCPVTGQFVDRDVNAARNLRDWPGQASPGLVEARVPPVSSPGGGAGDGGPDTRTSGRPGSARKTTRQPRKAARGETRTQATTVAREPRNGCTRMTTTGHPDATVYSRTRTPRPVVVGQS